jgi:branched-chain amino acid transport system substrate-binding protein
MVIRLLAAIALLLSGCSALTLEPRTCAESSECRDAFGRGHVCGEAGLCVAAPAPDRCTSFPSSLLVSPAEHVDDLVIASVFDQGDFALMVRSAQLAVRQVNDRDGLAGRAVGIIECSNADADDDGYADGLAPDDATESLVRWLADAQGVPAVVGPATSGRSERAFNALDGKDTLLISPSATSPALTAIDGLTSTDEAPGLFWRTAPPDSLQGEVIALELTALGADRVAVIAQTGAYGEGLAEVFQRNFDGADQDSQLFPFANTTDLSAAVVSAGDGSFDAVLVISSSTADASAFLNAAGALDGEPYESMTVFLPDGGFDVQLLQETRGVSGEALWPRIRGTVPRTPRGPAFDSFVANYQAVFEGEDPRAFGFSAHAYDAAWLSLVGAAWAEHNEDAIGGLTAARGLRRISNSSFGEPLQVGPNAWTDLQANFAEGRSVDVQGASGSLDYDSDTGETTAPLNIWQVDVAAEELQTLYCVDVSPSPSADCCTDPTTEVCAP